MKLNKLTPTQIMRKMKQMLEMMENFPSQTNQETIIMAKDSMTKARAKRLQDELNARFSVFNKELEI